MILGDIIYNDEFDCNCNFVVYKGVWNDSREKVYDTATSGYSKPPCALLDKKVKYITTTIVNSHAVLVIEIE